MMGNSPEEKGGDQTYTRRDTFLQYLVSVDSSIYGEITFDYFMPSKIFLVKSFNVRGQFF